MVKVLSRDAMQRMTGRRSSTTSTVSGGGGDSGVSQAWVEEHYISKDFFNQLFTIHGTRTYVDEETQEEVTEEVVITPNSIADGEEYKMSNVEVSVGLWTQQFLSALGLNPGGGGGGGATSLAELVDVTLSNPQNGQALVYNSSTRKWVNGTVIPDLTDYATKSWVNSQGFIKGGDSARLRAIEFSEVPSTANDGGYIDFHFNGSSADYTSRIIENTAAGQLIVNNAAAFYLNAVTGANIMSPVTAFSSRNFRARITNSLLADTLCLSGPLIMRNAQGISMIDTGGTERIALRLDTGNNLVLGENFQNYGVYLRGNDLHFQTGTSNTESLRVDANGNVLQTRNNTAYILHNTSNGNVTVMRLDNNNVFELGYGTVSPDYATSIFGGSTKGIGLYAGSTLVASIYRDAYRNGLRIGNALLSWDSTNNALCVQRYDGAAMDIYATGGVSALGFSPGVSQINAMTFNHLSVKNSMTFNGSVNIVTGTTSYMVRRANDSDCIYLMNTSAQSKINSRQYYYNQYDNVGLHGTNYNYDDSWFIDPDGCARFSRVYLNSNTYIYTNGSDLMLTIGSTRYKLTKTTA